MTDLNKELFFASFRGIPFLLDSHTMEDGRKVVTHEYPNKKYVYVEDLGQKLRNFQIDAIVTGDDYIIRRDALILALNVAGVGILTHPFLGVINVSVINYTLTEAPNRLGEARFNINFQEGNVNIFPLASSSNSATINSIVESLESYALAGFATVFTTAFNKNISNDANKCNNLATKTNNNITQVSDINQDALNNFKNNNSVFINNRFFLAQDSAGLGSAVYTLLSSYSDIANDAVEQYALNASLFGFGSDDIITNVDTAPILELRGNYLAINSLVNMAALSFMYLAASQMTFLSDVELEDVINDLESKYKYLMDNNNLDETTLIELENLRITAINYFNNLLTNVSKVFNTTINFVIPLTVLLYGYYENFDYEDEIISLNDIYDASFITGNITLLSSQVV